LPGRYPKKTMHDSWPREKRCYSSDCHIGVWIQKFRERHGKTIYGFFSDFIFSDTLRNPPSFICIKKTKLAQFPKSLLYLWRKQEKTLA
jgi:hypothetical protein